MQLNDILEENSIKMMSQKTKISEENLENLLAKSFENLKKAKALGFISIIEREYSADLKTLHQEASAYYDALEEDKSITLGVPIQEEKKGKSKVVLFVILGLLGYVSWYFLTQFDNKYLNDLVPFMDEDTIENFVAKDANKTTKLYEASSSNVEMPLKAEVNDTPVTQTITAPEDDNIVADESPNQMSVSSSMSIVPVSRLWFGVIDKETKKRKNFSISDAYTLDTITNTWLLATSSAPFSLKNDEVTQAFNDAKEHYFKIDKNGAVELTKNDYVSLGGWVQW